MPLATNLGIILVLAGKMFRIILTFYRVFYVVTGSISLIFCFFLWQSKGISSAFLLLWAKIISNLLIGFLFITFKREGLYFYNNLGYSSARMYLSVMLVDILISMAMGSIVLFLR